VLWTLLKEYLPQGQEASFDEYFQWDVDEGNNYIIITLNYKNEINPKQYTLTNEAPIVCRRVFLSNPEEKTPITGKWNLFS
jgi:hypothetical protein